MPGRHPGLFQISQLFSASFSADFSPGQEEQPMFWFKEKFLVRDVASDKKRWNSLFVVE